MPRSILSARELRAHAGGDPGHRLLDDVTLDLVGGEVVAVIGESGSGKSTLGRALLGERAAGVTLTGSVLLDGTDLLSCTAAQRRATRATTIGYLPQHPATALNPVRRIGPAMREFAALSHPGTARTAAVERAFALARVDAIPDLPRRYPHELSAGQQQRVALALALVNEPRVLVLDEPTAGLDALTSSEVTRTLARLAERGGCVVVLTHDVALVRELAHEVLVLDEGRVADRDPGTLPPRVAGHDATGRLGACAPAPSVAYPGSPAHSESGLRAAGLVRRAANETPILRKVDLAVRRGRCLAVVGRSGAGKTTLARCLTGLTRPDSGRITLDGRQLPANLRRRDRRHVQYVHQDARASFDEHRLVLGQIARTAQRLRGLRPAMAREEATTLLASLGVPARGRRRPSEFSGGQLRRAALARALLARPAVLICDEITADLDTQSRCRLLAALSETVSEGAAVIVIGHDLSELSTVADEVCVLDDGECSEAVPLADVLDTQGHPVTRELLAERTKSVRQAGA